MKRFLSILLAAALVVGLAGCSSRKREPVTEEKFRTVLEGEGYALEEARQEDPACVTALQAQAQDGPAFQFYEMDTVLSGTLVFSAGVESARQRCQDQPSRSTQSTLLNRESFSIQVSDFCFRGYRENNIVVLAVGGADSDPEIQRIFELLNG